MTYALRGAPDSSGVPEFLTQSHEFRHHYLPSLTAKLGEALLQAPQEVFFEGLERVLVSDQLFKEVRQQFPTVRMRGIKPPVKAPEFLTASRIVEEFLQRVRQELPPPYVSEAEQVVLAAGRRYAANVPEATKALGVNLPQ